MPTSVATNANSSPISVASKSSVRSRDALEFGALVVLFLLLRIPFVFTVPPLQAPDEPNHLWVVQYISQHFHSPSPNEVFDAGLLGLYGTVPPIGYYASAFTAWLTHAFIPFTVAARLGNLLVSVPTLWVAYAVGKRVFSTRLLALALPLLVAVHPQLVFAQAYCNSDGTLISLCSIAILLCLYSLERGTNYFVSLLIGCTIGGAALAKTNGFALVPALIWALWMSCRFRRQPMTKFLKVCAMFGAGVVGVCAWPLARNYLEYDGDFLGTHTMNMIWCQFLPHLNGKPVLPFPPVQSMPWWRYLWFDFWGLFGMMDKYLWRPAYAIFGAMVASAVTGWILGRNKSSGAASGQLSATDAALSEPVATTVDKRARTAIWQMFGGCTVLNLAAVMYVTIIGVSGPHGRYLFPCEIPLLCMILAGFSRLGSRAERILSLALFVLCLACTVGGWLHYYAGQGWWMNCA